MTSFWKSVALALGMSAVLCACTSGPPGNPPQGLEPVSQESSLAEPFPESHPSGPMPVAVDFGIQFLEALHRGDIAQMEKMVWNGEAGTLAYWETVTLGNTFDFHYDEAQADDSYALLEVLLHVKKPGKAPLQPGENQLMLTIGCPPYAIDSDIRVLSLIPKTDYDLNRSEDPAAFQVQTFRSWGSVEPFGSAAQIAPDVLLNYVVTAASRDFSEHADGFSYEPVEELSQEQIDQTASRYFGIERLVRTDAACYDSEKQVYRLFGRDGGNSPERVVSSVELPDGNHEVVIGWFGGDPLALLPRSQTRYLLVPNGDGSYRFLSAIQEDFQP